MSGKKKILTAIKKIYSHDFFKSPNTPCLSSDFQFLELWKNYLRFLRGSQIFTSISYC